MTSRVLLGSVALLAVILGSAFSQQPRPSTYTPPTPIPEPQTIPPTDNPARPAQEKSLDQLLDELEALRDKKTEIEKKEAELMKAIQRKVEKHADRMNRLGVGGAGVPVVPVPATPSIPPPPPFNTPQLNAPVPDRVGRIVIVGEKEEKKILELVQIAPGQVLNYPSLEAARRRLVKAGYKSVTVEMRPGDGGLLKDVVVTVGGER
jgi:hypothetical protein